jgi:hypothetical protein
MKKCLVKCKLSFYNIVNGSELSAQRLATSVSA